MADGAVPGGAQPESALAARVRRSLRSGPAPTIRLKLTVTYGVVFLFTGAVLLTIGYILVRHNLNEHADYRTALKQLGVKGPALPPRYHRPHAANALLNAVHAQLRRDALHQLVVDYLLALAVMTTFSGITGWWLAGRALSPLRAITATARRVSGQNLGERIGLTGPADELKLLADTFDGMLERLDAAFGSQRHFVANASHELRTPLAIMRTEVDVALADEEVSIDELRGMGEAIRETIDRCERLIESLLMLARSEALTGRGEPVELSALAADCLTDLRARAQEADITLRLSLEPAWAHGEPRLLERMIANLIDNGIRHNERGGFLAVRTGVAGGQAVVTVGNGGEPIAPEDAATLMEPFRRIHRQVTGFGLGLSIVRSVAEVHGGTAAVTAPASGGLEVTVRVPAEPAKAPARNARTADAAPAGTFTKN